jgi:FdhD protein
MLTLEASYHAPPAAQRVARQAWHNGCALPGERTLAEEVPVAFSYDGVVHAVLMATPDALEDFALGFTYTGGIITAPAEIAELAVLSVADGIVLRMGLAAARSDAFRRGVAALSDRLDAACAGSRVWPKPTAQYRS